MEDRTSSLVAIFLDFENLVFGAAHSFPGGLPLPLPLEPIVDYACTKGSVVLRRAYADWAQSECQRYVSVLVEHGFELIYLPQTSRSGKNGADVRLAIDVMEVMEHQPSISTYVIGSGDTDFIPLLQKVRARCKDVIVVGFEDSVGRLVKANTTEFASLDEICAPQSSVPLVTKRMRRERKRRPEKGQRNVPKGAKSSSEDELEDGDSGEDTSYPAPKGSPSEHTTKPGTPIVPQTVATLSTPSRGAETAQTSVVPQGSTPLERGTPKGVDTAQKLLSPKFFDRTQIPLAMPTPTGGAPRAGVAARSPSQTPEHAHPPHVQYMWVREQAGHADPDDREPPLRVSEGGTPLEEWSTACRLVERFQRNYRMPVILLSKFKEQLMRLDSSFSERRFGFGSFYEFVQALIPEYVSCVTLHQSDAGGTLDANVFLVHRSSLRSSAHDFGLAGAIMRSSGSRAAFPPVSFDRRLYNEWPEALRASPKPLNPHDRTKR